MIYLDTSFVAPFYINETTSERIEALFSARSDDFAVSYWLQVEFASLLSRKQRMGEFTQRASERTMTAFKEDMRRSFLLLTPTQKDYELALSFILRQGSSLRGPDALHLAVAANSGANAIYSLDVKLIEEANVLGLSASDGGVGSG